LLKIKSPWTGCCRWQASCFQVAQSLQGNASTSFSPTHLSSVLHQSLWRWQHRQRKADQDIWNWKTNRQYPQ
jgi:hypothetical protein